MFVMQATPASSVYSREVCEIGTHCLVSDRIFGSTALRADLGVRIITAARRLSSRKAHWGFIQVLYLASHTNLLASLLSMTSQHPRRRRTAEHLHGLLCY